MSNQINIVKTKLLQYLEAKYPTTFAASGFSNADIEKISAKIVDISGTDKTKLKSNITHFLGIIESKLKTKIYSENRINRTVNTEKFTLDPLIDISHETYAKVNFKPDISTTPVNSLNPVSSDVNEYKTAFDEDKHIAESRQPDIYNPETRTFVYNIVIDSKDRDKTKYPSASSFVIDFSPATFDPNNPGSANSGYISRAFGNIISCEILDITLYDSSKISDSSDSVALGIPIPYLLLELNEFGSNFYGTNDILNTSFGMLTSYSIIGNYKYYDVNSENSNQTFKKVFNPRVNLNKLTIRIKLPDGTPYNFGSVNESEIATLFKLTFRITCLQKNLATNYYGKAVY